MTNHEEVVEAQQYFEAAQAAHQAAQDHFNMIVGHELLGSDPALVAHASSVLDQTSALENRAFLELALSQMRYEMDQLRQSLSNKLLELTAA